MKVTYAFRALGVDVRGAASGGAPGVPRMRDDELCGIQRVGRLDGFKSLDDHFG